MYKKPNQFTEFSFSEYYPNYYVADSSKDLYGNENKTENILLCLIYHIGVKCIHQHKGFVDKIIRHLDSNTQKYLTAFLQVLLSEVSNRLDVTEDLIKKAYKISSSKLKVYKKASVKYHYFTVYLVLFLLILVQINKTYRIAFTNLCKVIF